MAKTRAQWKTVLETEKATKTTLDTWITGLLMAWRAWLNVVAGVLEELDIKYDTQKVLIEAAADLVQPYTQEWYRQKLLAYQDGDEVMLINNDWTYLVINTDKQICKAAVVHTAITNVSYGDEPAVSYHAAIIDGNEDFEIMDLTGGIDSYFEKIKAPGSVIQSMFTWSTATNLNIDADVYIDHAVINSATGALRSDAAVFPVVDAIKKYVDEYVNVTGYLRNQTLLDYLQDVPGVIGVDLTNQRYDQAGGTTYSNVSRVLYNKRVTQYLLDGTSALTYM